MPQHMTGDSAPVHFHLSLKYFPTMDSRRGRQDPGESRDVFYKGGRVQVTAKIRFRGVLVAAYGGDVGVLVCLQK